MVKLFALDGVGDVGCHAVGVITQLSIRHLAGLSRPFCCGWRRTVRGSGPLRRGSVRLLCAAAAVPGDRLALMPAPVLGNPRLVAHAIAIDVGHVLARSDVTTSELVLYHVLRDAGSAPLLHEAAWRVTTRVRKAAAVR